MFNYHRTQAVESARADAERVRLTGAAEARAIEAVGRAEAEKMRMKASAYKQYGDAAVMALVLEALPQVIMATCQSVMPTFAITKRVLVELIIIILHEQITPNLKKAWLS